jgi:hypothetical protein
MKSEESQVKKLNNFSTFDDLSKTISFLAKDISIFLGEEIEELNVSSYIFRSGIERALTRIMNALVKQAQPVVIFPDSVPGFTLMVFKKTAIPQNVNALEVERNPAKEVKEAEILDNVISRFFNKNNQKVLIIENIDVIFALFPVADTRKNLRDLELYVTF